MPVKPGIHRAVTALYSVFECILKQDYLRVLKEGF
jgi:hypothetical protein